MVLTIIPSSLKHLNVFGYSKWHTDISEDSKLSSTNEKKHVRSVVLNQGFLSIMAVPISIHSPANFIFLSGWIIFHCVNVPHRGQEISKGSWEGGLPREGRTQQYIRGRENNGTGRVKKGGIQKRTWKKKEGERWQTLKTSWKKKKTWKTTEETS